MDTKPPITIQTPILEIVERYPKTVAVFNRLNMACPGCHISPFHTVADGAREYNLEPSELLRALNRTLDLA